ncbi:MAG: YebC/PmpR family DNA-binding transcriptional regulator [Candidatus Hydrogenedentes bacterium]|nr:YebC/PmpR family DNA-binding transcriptional regulator [Candidatus Hydrogenedentota bacterium]
MSGHSKWSTIKRKKGALDAKRGKIFSRLAKEITIAVRQGGPDPAGNARLRAVLIACRNNNMPRENIDRAIKCGTGEIEGAAYEEIRYEAYGPGGVGILIDVTTDNKNRTLAEIRHLVTKSGGSMAAANAVAWNFDSRGVITVPKEGISDDEILEKAIEAGADDVDSSGDVHEIYTDPTQLHAVADAFEQMGIKAQEIELKMIPKTMQKVDGKMAAAVLKLLDALEEHDDVQNVFSNADISEQDMEAALNE